MSLWSNWQCPKCDRKWYGGIGFDFTARDKIARRDELNERLEKICGCTGKKLTKKELSSAKIIIYPGNKK